MDGARYKHCMTIVFKDFGFLFSETNFFRIRFMHTTFYTTENFIFIIGGFSYIISESAYEKSPFGYTFGFGEARRPFIGIKMKMHNN